MATLRSTYGDQAEVLLADVSTHGCNVKGAFAWLRAGCYVSIALDEEPLTAIVRWIRDDAAGMEFLWPVPRERCEWHRLMNSPLGI